MAKMITALVLCDVPVHGLKAGQLVEASTETMKELQNSGSIDPDKGAVNAARAAGATVARSLIEAAREEVQAAAAARRAEVAALEEQLAKAQAEDEKNALAQQIVEKRAALADLGA